MNITLAKSAGFCFGVSKAVNTAYALANSGKGNIFTLGEIIHNNIVIDQLAEHGVQVVHSVSELKNILSGSGGAAAASTVIIRAHGVPKAVYEELETLGVQVVDATCPFVAKIQKLVMEKYNEGYQIVITGNAAHPEVVGINGWCGNSAVILSEPEQVFALDSTRSDYCFVSQTTYSLEKWNKIIENCKKQFDKFQYFDTICSATVKRQQEAAGIAEKADLMIVIGDKLSSNTLKLVEICASRCPHTILIESPRDLSEVDLINITQVGITAGASTPEPVIEEVISKMSEVNTNTNENFETLLEESLTTLTTGQTVKGNIIRVDDKGVFIDLGFKYEGFVAINEFKEQPSVGDEVEAVVVRVNDKDGEVILSKRKIDSKRNLKFIEEAYENKTPVTVYVTEAVNGGLVGNVNGVRVFVPASQLASRYVSDVTSYLKSELEVRIVTFEKGDRNRLKVVGSHKVIDEENKARVSEEFWSNVEVGKVYHGKVRSLTNFGAFVDLGGIDGLVHLSELSWKKIRHPSEVLSVGDEIDVFVLRCDPETKKISLGYRKDEDNPWNNISERYNVGDIVTAKVVKFLPFGVFVEIESGLDGLVHISQISNVRLNKAQEVLSMGQVVEAKIVELNPETKKINLSIKEVAPIDPVREEEPEEVEEVTEAAVEEVPAEVAETPAEVVEEAPAEVAEEVSEETVAEE